LLGAIQIVAKISRRYRHLALKMPRCHDLHLRQMSIFQDITIFKFVKIHKIAIWRKYRDYRSVELASDAENRIPLGMRPIGGCIPTACNEWRTGIFYRAMHP